MSEQQQWLYIDATGQQVGPVAAEQLHDYVSAGHINAESQVWTEGMEEWLPASQIEGLIPAAAATPPPIPEQSTPPVHQPQINLGPIRSGGVTTGQATTGTPINTYTAPKKSPIKWIILGIVGLLVLGFVIMVAIAPSEEELANSIPGYTELKEAHKSLNGIGSTNGNTPKAIKIAARAKKLLAEVREEGIEKGITGSGKFSAYCHIKEVDELTHVIVIFRVPKIRKFADDAKKFISDYAWIVSKVATMNNMDKTDKVKLVVAVRGVIFYDTMHVGEPLITGDPSENHLEGVEETFTEQDCETQLYPYFTKE